MPNKIAKQNIERVVEKTGVVALPSDLIKKIFHNLLMKFRNLIPCEMCTHILGKALTLKILFDHQVLLSINGLDRGQLFARLNYPLYREFLYDNFLPYSESRIEENLKRFTLKTNMTFAKL